MTRIRAVSLLNLLNRGIGYEPQLSADEYKWLMENENFLSDVEKADYITNVVCFLRTNHSQPIPEFMNYNEGDRLEHWLGIPRNNYAGGDLFGIELKSWNGSTPLRFKATTRILTMAKNRMVAAGWPMGENIQDYIYYPAHHDGLSQTNAFHRRPLFLAKTGDQLRNLIPNTWGRLRLQLNLNDYLEIWVRCGVGRWMKCVQEINMRMMFEKYQRGLIVVQRKKFRDGRIALQSTEVLLGVTPDWLIGEFRNGNLFLELRLKSRRNPQDPGQGFQVTATQIDELRYFSDLVEEDRSINWTCPSNIF